MDNWAHYATTSNSLRHCCCMPTAPNAYCYKSCNSVDVQEKLNFRRKLRRAFKPVTMRVWHTNPGHVVKRV